MNIQDRFKQITTFVFDVDGVLTDGTVFLFENGHQVRRMSIRDGYALQLAIKKGYRIVVVSGADSPSVTMRLNKLGIREVHMNVVDKKSFIQSLIESAKLNAGEVLFMGDDMPDLAAMSVAGLPVCPADAIPEVRQAAKYISPVHGGNGCVRDVLEVVLKLNDHWEVRDDIASR